MANSVISILVDLVPPHTLRVVLLRDGQAIDELQEPVVHNADNILLTGVDKLLQRNSIDESALTVVQVGPGVDKNSSLYRIVTSFAAAITAAGFR